MSFNPDPKPEKGSKRGFKPNLDAVYKILKARKLLENPNCQAKLDGCKGQAGEIHHVCGRRNIWLVIYEFFLSVCRNCHNKITEDSKMAYKKGLSISSGREDVKKRWQWVKDNLLDYLTSINIKV